MAHRSDRSGFVDMHCHSSASSDALGKPREIAEFFSRHGYEAFAVTDHTSWKALDETRAAAAELDVEFVPGIEISCRVEEPALRRDPAEPETVDILAYYYRRTDELREVVTRRDGGEWYRAGIERLNDKGVIDFGVEYLEEVNESEYGDDPLKETLSAYVVGKAMQNRGVSDAGWPPRAAWAPIKEVHPREESAQEHPTATEVTTAIQNADGVSILAHPGKQSDGVSNSERERAEEGKRIERWVDGFVDGVEIYHPANADSYRDMLRSVVEKESCPYTGGSDRHGYGSENNDSDAPVRCLKRLKEAADR